MNCGVVQAGSGGMRLVGVPRSGRHFSSYGNLGCGAVQLDAETRA